MIIKLLAAFICSTSVFNPVDADQNTPYEIIEDPTALIIKFPAKQRQGSVMNTVDADQNTPYEIIEDPTALIVKTPAKLEPIEKQGSAQGSPIARPKQTFNFEFSEIIALKQGESNNNYRSRSVDIDCVCESKYKAGDRVTSLVDSPDGNADIVVGSLGTVICGDVENNWGLPLLVEWDDTTTGHDGLDYCDCGDDAGPVGSNQCWLVQCDWVAEAESVYCVCESKYKAGDRVTSLVDSPDGNADIVVGSLGTVICGDVENNWGLPLLVEWDDTTTGHDGLDYCDCGDDAGPVGSNQCWLVQCDWVAEAGSVYCVCESKYKAGDRVTSLVDSPDGNADIVVGSLGTVICGDVENNWGLPLLVEWDDTTTGHDGLDYCDCGDDAGPVGSNQCWLVQCDWVAEAGSVYCVCESKYKAGDRVTSLVDSPDGNADIVVGSLGTVICGDVENNWGLPLLVEWDDTTTGHDGLDYCDCGDDAGPVGSNQCWLVQCDWVQALGDTTPCPGDMNDDGTVAVADLLALIASWGPCTGCSADLDGNGTVDVADLLQLIALWGDCPEDAPLGVCVIPNLSCTIVNEADCTSSGGMGWLESGSCDDTDGDRIPDDFELGDCSVPSGAYSGSYSNDIDSDNDGINDGDEAYGTLNGLDLPLFGCNPCKYDILVEVDWVYGTGTAPDAYKLHANQAANVVASFANSPVVNEDSTLGINIHIDYGQYPYNDGNSVADPNGNNVVDMDNWDLDGSEYQAIKDANFAANREGYFHYSLSVWKFSNSGVSYGYSGVAEINGDDFILATGQYFSGDDDRIGSTFMHELGHNLNLRHGGDENLNYKPNYNSVMNYRFQMCGVDDDGDTFPDSVLDYSRGSYIDLNESDLDETIGVTGWGPAIDWDLDGNSNETGVTRNVNCKIWDAWNCGPYSLTTKSCGSGSDCGDSSCNVVSDYNDWTNIVYAGISEGDFAPKEIIFCGPQDSLPNSK